MSNKEETKSSEQLKTLNRRKGNCQSRITKLRTFLTEKVSEANKIVLQTKIDCVVDIVAKLEDLKLEYYEVLDDDALEEVELQFENLEEELESIKTVLMVVIQGIFRDERYFSKPNEFIPERWLSKDEKFHPFAFLPFGFGTRSCIGRRLAELEILCLTAELIRNFKIEYHHEEIGYYTRIINIPDKPLRFNFIER